jgi:hypothetical protein
MLAQNRSIHAPRTMSDEEKFKDDSLVDGKIYD